MSKAKQPSGASEPAPSDTNALVDADTVLDAVAEVIGRDDDAAYFSEMIARYMPEVPGMRNNLTARRTPKVQRDSLLKIAATCTHAADSLGTEIGKANNTVDAVSVLNFYLKRQFGSVTLVEILRSAAERARDDAETVGCLDGRNKHGEHIAVFVAATCWLQAFKTMPSDATNSTFSKVMDILFPFFHPGIIAGKNGFRSRIRGGLAYWEEMNSPS